MLMRALNNFRCSISFSGLYLAYRMPSSAFKDREPSSQPTPITVRLHRLVCYWALRIAKQETSVNGSSRSPVKMPMWARSRPMPLSISVMS